MFQAYKDPSRAQIVFHNLKIMYQKGVITRTALEETWQREMGGPLPTDVAQIICVARNEKEDEVSASILTPEGHQMVRQLRAAGLSVEDILTALEAAKDQRLLPEVSKRLREEIEKLG